MISDIKKPKLLVFKVWPDRDSAEFSEAKLSDISWSAPIPVNDVGKMTVLMWNRAGKSKHVQVERFVDPHSKILFITFIEEL